MNTNNSNTSNPRRRPSFTPNMESNDAVSRDLRLVTEAINAPQSEQQIDSQPISPSPNVSRSVLRRLVDRINILGSQGAKLRRKIRQQCLTISNLRRENQEVCRSIIRAREASFQNQSRLNAEIDILNEEIGALRREVNRLTRALDAVHPSQYSQTTVSSVEPSGILLNEESSRSTDSTERSSDANFVVPDHSSPEIDEEMTQTQSHYGSQTADESQDNDNDKCGGDDPANYAHQGDDDDEYKDETNEENFIQNENDE